MLKALKSDACVVERHDFKTRLDIKTASYKSQMKDILRNKDVATTMDHWTASGYTPILGVVAHYIENFQLKELKLACRLALFPHTAENVKKQFTEVYE